MPPRTRAGIHREGLIGIETQMDVEGGLDGNERTEDWPVIDESLTVDSHGDEPEPAPTGAAVGTGSDADTGEISFDEAMDSLDDI